MRITEETIERIKQENDIVDVISETVKLKRSGRNYMGLCPFHGEKSPSFSVSQDKQIYKCFGCGEAGNVLTFVMKQKNLNFIESCKLLAERANIPLNLGNGEESKVVKKKELLYKINVEAARYFFSNLQRDKNAKEYFTNRGMKEVTIKRFGLGYAKDGWQNLRMYLKKKGFNEALMLEAGLVIKSQKGTVYDRFRNRVMFPVFNIKGEVIGFGGRVLDDSKPKYLNSPETLVFQKGTNLYGLNFAIKNKIEERYFIIVEGYMDLISLHQYGITNVVASLGTALTVNQARLLKRYADKVIISYDADVAGQTATLRGLEILKEAGFDVRVLQIPQGKDPDEFVRSNGREAFLKLVNKADSLIGYRLSKAKEGINFKDKSSLVEYGNRVTEILANLNPVEKDIYVKSISEDTGIKEQSLYDLIAITRNTKSDDLMNKKEEYGTKLYVEPGYIKAEKSLIKLMLEDDCYEDITLNISSDDLNSKAHAKIFNLIKEAKENGLNDINLHVEAGCDDVDSSKEWVKIKEFQVLKARDVQRLVLDYIKQIKDFKLRKKVEELKVKLKGLEKEGLIEESIKIALELNKINDALKRGERV
ncbi:DNA primase [Clostridium sardiniense]|uniref:DNA primase n=1 Tax=Clostridium sardiniense TaxID=29369 RepID=UPI00195829BF|nr:DNA primase [Clostridium sardiniense]MBM7833704.1 DNA primase [Clostridium sardiniense]